MTYMAKVTSISKRSLHGNESRLKTFLFRSHPSERVPVLTPATINLLYPLFLRKDNVFHVGAQTCYAFLLRRGQELIRYKPLLSISCSAFIKEDNEGQMLFVRDFAGPPRVPVPPTWCLMDLVKLSALGCFEFLPYWMWRFFISWNV